MKQNLLTMLAFLLVASGYAQISPKNVEVIKSSKIIVAQYESAEMSAAFKETIEEFWSFTEIAEYLPVEQALEKAQADESYLVFKVGTHKASSMWRDGGIGGWDYRYVNSGETLEITNGKKPLAFINIPKYSGNQISKEIFVFGVSILQQHLSTMDKHDVNLMKAMKMYESDISELKQKELLIPEGWTDEKLTQQIAEENYPHPIKIVSYEEWKNAIINREEGKAYVMLSPIPTPNGPVYRHYLMDCKGAKMYTLQQPKLAVSMDTKGAGMVNVSKGNTGYVNKKNVKDYAKAVGN